MSLSLKEIDLTKKESYWDKSRAEEYVIHKDVMGDDKQYLAKIGDYIAIGVFSLMWYGYILMSDPINYDLDEIDELYEIQIT